MLDSLELSLFIQNIQSRLEQRATQLLTPLGLTPQQAYVLAYLHQHAGAQIQMKDIEARFNLSHPTATALIKRLESKELVERYIDHNDHRKRLIRLNCAKTQVFRQASRFKRQMDRNLSLGMDEDQKQTLHNLLGQLYVNLEA